MGADHGTAAAGKLTGSLGDANLRQEPEEAISKTAITRKRTNYYLLQRVSHAENQGPRK